MRAVGLPTAICDQKDTAWAVRFLIEHRLVALQTEVANRADVIFCWTVLFAYLCSMASSGKRKFLEQNSEAGSSAKKNASSVSAYFGSICLQSNCGCFTQYHTIILHYLITI